VHAARDDDTDRDVTAQIADRLVWCGVTYDMATVAGGPLFEPRSYGLKPAPLVATCTRGFQAQYSVKKNKLVVSELLVHFDPAQLTATKHQLPTVAGVSPSASFPGRAIYANLELPIPLTGGLLLGVEPLRALLVPQGIQPAWKYRQVRELTFRAGGVVSERDLSSTMEELRRRLGITETTRTAGGVSMSSLARDVVDPALDWLQTQLVLPYPWR
jgi:hypothetical protein